MSFVQVLAESPNLNSIPSNYTYFANSNEPPASDLEDSVPVIDFSLLTSNDPDQRSKVIKDLDHACKDWGFFQVINHGVHESLMKKVLEKSNEFFNMTVEEKKDFEEKDVFDPIRYGTSFNSKKDEIFYWRDFLRFTVHPKFHFLNKPLGFSEVLSEYSKRTREIAKGLLTGISSSLGIDQSDMEKDLKLDSSLQVCVVNLYPPCPQPELAMGMPPHSDHGLFTLIINNGVGGLQIKRKGKWVNVNDTISNAFLVNTADHLEIFSNGMYKSIEHRAVVNNAVTRISVVMTHGPSLDAVVKPAHQLVDEEISPAAYVPMTYKQYLDLQLDNPIAGKKVQAARQRTVALSYM
ncbi:DMR6-like oxygenase 2-like protein [Tanacetum coccineum]